MLQGQDLSGRQPFRWLTAEDTSETRPDAVLPQACLSHVQPAVSLLIKGDTKGEAEGSEEGKEASWAEVLPCMAPAW